MRFAMRCPAPARFPFLLFALSLLAPVHSAARPQSNFTYGPLPVFELHSGFWINLHHTLYHQAILRTVAPLVREQGMGRSERLAEIYPARWPREKLRVDLSGYANASGAYTTADPLRVTISSLYSRNQGSAALEVLFHEGSHGIAEPVQAAIIRECRQRDKAIPRDLWHALVFYTTGEVIRPVLGSSGATAGDQDGGVPGGGYTPYALREGLYQRGWNDYFKLLQKFWQPYLDGSATFDDAIARMVSSL